MHLRYCIMTAHLQAGETRHAQEVMRALGITYQHATPQSLGDCWWFWNCKNVPAELPVYLEELKVKPRDAVGWGLTQQEAESIEAAA